jgi:pimeloyl-ACP methyl ester carboxylesterase
MAETLAATEYGEGEPVALLHGLFGAGRNWTAIARRLAARCRVIVFDLRNHGDSPWASSMDYRAMARDLRAGMAARGHHRYRLIGHSMGGKTAMIAALTEPQAIERLVVVDIAPVVYPVPYLDFIQAMRRLDLTAISRRKEADAALAAAVPDPAERAFLLQSLVFGDGPPRWQLNLAALESELPVISGFPESPTSARYPGPALFVGGAKSEYFRPEHDAAIRALFPRATIERIDGAGHWVHIERPHDFLALVEPFLAG